MLRYLNTSMSRRLTGFALAAALTFSVASFALPDQTHAADGNGACPGVVASQDGSLDETDRNGNFELSGGDARAELAGGDAHIETSGGDAHIETSGGDITAALENLATETNCGQR
jgi:hypothetical protein